MMHPFRKFIYTICLLLFTTMTMAQEKTGESKIGEFMRSNNRIYVVAAVMLTILTGLIIYLVRLDRKISRLEKER